MGPGATKDADATVYDGGRDIQSVMDFLNAKAGLHRRMDGHLDRQAGRTEALDSLVGEWLDAGSDLEREAVAVRAAAEEGGRYYAKVMRKGVDYYEAELERLEGIVAGGSLSAAKYDSFEQRINVLLVFSGFQQD